MKNEKMIAHTVVGVLLFTILPFYGCEKEEAKIEESFDLADLKTETQYRSAEGIPEDVNTITTSAIFTEYCEENELDFHTDNYLFYSEEYLNLYHFELDEFSSIAVIENTDENAFIVLRKEVIEDGYLVYGLIDNILYTPFPIEDVPAAPPGTPTYPENYDPDKLCREQGYSYGECVECAWADLNSSLSGALACTFSSTSCWVAAGIHCALGVAPTPGGTYASYFTHSVMLTPYVQLLN